MLEIHSKKGKNNQLVVHMPWYVSRTDCIALYVDRTAGSQTICLKGFIILLSGNINSAFHGLNLAAIHEQEKWHHHFWHATWN